MFYSGDIFSSYAETGKTKDNVVLFTDHSMEGQMKVHPPKHKFRRLPNAVFLSLVCPLLPTVALVPCGEITRRERKGAKYPYSHLFMKRRQPSAKCLFTLTLHH